MFDILICTFHSSENNKIILKGIDELQGWIKDKW